jgi:hypothetical protein
MAKAKASLLARRASNSPKKVSSCSQINLFKKSSQWNSKLQKRTTSSGRNRDAVSPKNEISGVLSQLTEIEKYRTIRTTWTRTSPQIARENRSDDRETIDQTTSKLKNGRVELNRKDLNRQLKGKFWVNIWESFWMMIIIQAKVNVERRV